MTFYNNLCKHHFLAGAEESQATSNSIIILNVIRVTCIRYNITVSTFSRLLIKSSCIPAKHRNNKKLKIKWGLTVEY